MNAFSCNHLRQLTFWLFSRYKTKTWRMWSAFPCYRWLVLYISYKRISWYKSQSAFLYLSACNSPIQPILREKWNLLYPQTYKSLNFKTYYKFLPYWVSHSLCVPFCVYVFASAFSGTCLLLLLPNYSLSFEEKTRIHATLQNVTKKVLSILSFLMSQSVI